MAANTQLITLANVVEVGPSGNVMFLTTLASDAALTTGWLSWTYHGAYNYFSRQYANVCIFEDHSNAYYQVAVTIPNSVPTLVTLTADNPFWRFSVNGSQVTTCAYGNVLKLNQIGKGYTYYLQGQVSELRISSSALGAELQAAIDNWLRDNANCYEMGPVETFETVAIDGLIVDRLNVEAEVDAILQEPQAPRGILRIDAIGMLAQLDKEIVHAYTATEKAVNTIVTELMALQQNPVPLTVGTIDYTAAKSISIPADTILGALKRLQESVGGYIYVDTSKALHWRSTIGSDTGQQLRFGKNLVNIRRTADYSELANRLWAWGAGEGESEIRLGKKTVLAIPTSADDTAEKGYADGAWSFSKSRLNVRVGRLTLSNALIAYGGGCRFPGITLAQGMTIVKAELRLKAYGQQPGSNLNTRVWGHNVNNSGVFTDITDYNTRLTEKTTAIATYDSVESWTTGQTYAISVTAIVQEIVNRVAWASGNAITIFWEDHEGRTTDRSYRSWHAIHDSENSPQLYIEATLPAAVDYLDDEASRALHGFCAAQVKDVAVTDSTTLFDLAVRLLGEYAYPRVSYNGQLADLERYGMTFDALALGNIVKVVDEGISMDVSTRIIHLTRNLVNRMDVNVELANRAATVLDKLQFSKDPRWRQHFY